MAPLSKNIFQIDGLHWNMKYECGMAPLSKNIFQIHIWHIALFKSSASHSCLTEKYRMGAPLWKIASFNTFSQRIINLSFFGSLNEFWVCWSYLVVTQKNIVMYTSTQVEVPKQNAKNDDFWRLHCNANFLTKFFPPPWVINDDTVGGCYLTKLKKIASHCQLNPLCFSFAWSMCKTELKKKEVVSFRLF